MAKSSSRQGSGGGGIGTRQHVKVGIKSGGPSTKKISPSAVADLGISKGDHVTNRGTVKRPANPLVTGTMKQVPSGNAVALNAAGSKAKPGAGRVVHSSGSQSQYGSARQGEGSLPNVPSGTGTAGQDLLSQFGPESSRGKR